MRQWRSVALSLAVVALAACGGSSGGNSNVTGPTTPPGGPTVPPDSPPPANTVTIANQAFNPSTLTVAKGTTVTWNWNDCSSDPYGYGGGGCVQHSVVFDDGSATSDVQDTGSFSRTFANPGTFSYHCGIHGSAMTGKIVVQ